MSLDWRSRAFIALAVMGIGDAVFHAYDEITFSFNSCYISQILSCKTVFASGYDSFLGVSFWVYGVVWFPVVLAVGLWAIRKHGSPYRNLMVPFLMIGNIFTLYPWDIEIRILGGVYCIVCVTLYCINYIMTAVALTSTSNLPAD